MIDAILTIIWTLAIFGLLFYVLWWGLGKLAIGEPWGKIATTILVVITVCLCIGLIFGRVPMIPFCQIGTVNACAGGTVRDSHGSSDPTVWLIIETITCPDGTVKLRLKPDPSPGLNQTGSWTIASVTGTFERLRGSGEMEAVYEPDPPRRLT